MKVKVLSRNPADYIRECKSDIHKIPRNIDPSLHPFEAAREYTRALNAAKLERVFAKPFVGSLDGHTDGVNCMAKFQKSLSLLLSGSCNGEVGAFFNNTNSRRVHLIAKRLAILRSSEIFCKLHEKLFAASTRNSLTFFS